MAEKRIIILAILETLQKYSDYHHHLKQQDIIDLLEKDYELIVERKAIAKNIEALINLGYDIEQANGYYLIDKNFDDSELMFLIDGVLASKYIPKKQALSLVDKLCSLSSEHFKKKIHSIKRTLVDRNVHNELFYNLDIIFEAIENNKKIAYQYNKFDLVNDQIQIKQITKNKKKVSPYEVVVNNGRYYLVANYNKYDNLIHLRIDRMSDVVISSELRYPLYEISEFKEKRNIENNYLNKHSSMYTGEVVNCDFLVEDSLLSEVIETFGNNTKVFKEKNKFKVRVRSDKGSLILFFKQFINEVVVLSPDELVNEIKNILEKSLANY
ncbi:MAG: helix-turn-helix transcriptional regulator [Erysipelotrichaceae bacterium]